ncbi:MAG: heme NO-binding protein [Leptolyngbya sp. SIO3F4]|nr:heme NO-binding protein [Leptolyngbya sp. SIO3F4]
MYGLINRAIQDMVCEYHGSDVWEKVKAKADVEDSRFLVLHSYPDDLTHRLVKAASEVLNLSSAEIMQAFGRYWVEYTGKAGYQELMEMAGETLPDFLNNLDELHSRIGIQFPELKPPEFEADQTDDSTIELHYQSSREGLAPMVVGLLEGLGERFHRPVQVTQTQDRQQGADHDIFHIEYDAE